MALRSSEAAALEDILKVEMLELTLGYQLIRLADVAQGSDLLERIRSMWRKIASGFGFLMPQVRIRDNLYLQPTQYQILLKGTPSTKERSSPTNSLRWTAKWRPERSRGN